MSVKSILVVEDDTAIRETIAMVLESEGYLVHTASNGAEGLTILKRGDRPNLILLDLNMPVMDGWEFMKVYPTTDGLAQVPIVVLTANGGSKIPGGVSEHFNKPIELANLLSVAQRYC